MIGRLVLRRCLDRPLGFALLPGAGGVLRTTQVRTTLLLLLLLLLQLLLLLGRRLGLELPWLLGRGLLGSRLRILGR